MTTHSHQIWLIFLENRLRCSYFSSNNLDFQALRSSKVKDDKLLTLPTFLLNKIKLSWKKGWDILIFHPMTLTFELQSHPRLKVTSCLHIQHSYQIWLSYLEKWLRYGWEFFIQWFWLLTFKVIQGERWRHILNRILRLPISSP